MKKLLFIIIGLIFIAASCNKTVSVDNAPVVSVVSEQPTKSTPKSDEKGKISANDLVIPKTEKEQDFQIDQNTIKNIEQDAKLEEHNQRLNDLENNVTTPHPTSIPESTPVPPPVADCTRFGYGTIVVNVVDELSSDINFGFWLYHSDQGRIWDTTKKSHTFEKAPIGEYKIQAMKYFSPVETDPVSGYLSPCGTITFNVREFIPECERNNTGTLVVTSSFGKIWPELVRVVDSLNQTTSPFNLPRFSSNFPAGSITIIVENATVSPSTTGVLEACGTLTFTINFDN